MPRLTITEGGQSSVFELLDDDVTIGRGASSSVQVADDHASKNHAVIRKVGGRAKLVDLESKNGTKVNGEFRNQRWLEHGDTVTIGNAVIAFDAGAAAGRAGGRGGSSARPVVSGAVAVGGAAAHVGGAAPPAPSRTSRTSRAGARSGSQRARRGEDDEDGEEGRVPARSSSNSTAVAVLAGAGGLGLLALLFLLFSAGSGGRSNNAYVLRQAKAIHAQGRVQEAYDFLKRESDSTDVDGYVSVKEELDKWAKQLSLQNTMVAAGDSEKEFKAIQNAWIEKWKNGLTDQAIGEKLREFAQKWKGTSKEMELRRSNYRPFPEFWRLLVAAEGKQPNPEAVKIARDIWTSAPQDATTAGARQRKMAQVEAYDFLKAHADPNADGYQDAKDLLATWEKAR